MVDASEAGPSRRRRRESDADDAMDGGTQRMRRSEVFTTLDPAVKARLTRDYQGLQSKADDMRANFENVDADQIINMLHGANKMFGVRDADIANHDARLVRDVAEMSSALVRKQKLGGASFDVDEMLLNVKRILDIETQEEDEQARAASDEDELEEDSQRRRRRGRRVELGSWEKIGWMAAKMSRRAPGIEFLYGPLSVEHKRKEKKARQRQELAPEQRPVEVQTQGKAPSTDPTLTNVRMVDKTLNRLDTNGDGVNFFEFVCNPESFSQTVENCFYVSFLIREGRAGIDVLDDGRVMIYARQQHSEDDDVDIVRHQAVMEMDMATWEEAIKLFSIRESLLPTRAPTNTAGPSATGWYGA